MIALHILSLAAALYVAAGLSSNALMCGSKNFLTEDNAKAAHWSLSDCYESTVVVVTSAACVGTGSCISGTIAGAVVVMSNSSNIFLMVDSVQLVNTTIMVSNISYYPSNSTLHLRTCAVVLLSCNVSASIITLTQLNSSRNTSNFSVGLLNVSVAAVVDSTILISKSHVLLSSLAHVTYGVQIQSASFVNSTVMLIDVSIRAFYGCVNVLNVFLTHQSYLIVDSLSASAENHAAFNIRANTVDTGRLVGSFLSLRNSDLQSVHSDGFKMWNVSVMQCTISVANITASSYDDSGMLLHSTLFVNTTFSVSLSQLQSSFGSALALWFTRITARSKLLFSHTNASVVDGMPAENPRGLMIVSSLLSASSFTFASGFLFGNIGTELRAVGVDGSSDVLFREATVCGDGVAFVLHESSCARSLIQMRACAVSATVVGLQVNEVLFDGTSELSLENSSFRSKTAFQAIRADVRHSALRIVHCSGVAETMLVLSFIQAEHSMFHVQGLVAVTIAARLVAFTDSFFDAATVVSLKKNYLNSVSGVVVLRCVMASLQLSEITFITQVVGVLYANTTCIASSQSALGRGSCCILLTNCTTHATFQGTAVSVFGVTVNAAATLLCVFHCSMVIVTPNTSLVVHYVIVAPLAHVTLIEMFNTTATLTTQSTGGSDGSSSSPSLVSIDAVLMSAQNRLMLCVMRSTKVFVLGYYRRDDLVLINLQNITVLRQSRHDWAALAGTSCTVVITGVHLATTTTTGSGAGDLIRISGVAVETLLVRVQGAEATTSGSILALHSLTVVSIFIVVEDCKWIFLPMVNTSNGRPVIAWLLISYMFGNTVSVAVHRCVVRTVAADAPVVVVADVVLGLLRPPGVFWQPLAVDVVSCTLVGFTAVLQRESINAQAMMPSVNVSLICVLWGPSSSPYELQSVRVLVRNTSQNFISEPMLNVSLVISGCTLTTSSSLSLNTITFSPTPTVKSLQTFTSSASFAVTRSSSVFPVKIPQSPTTVLSSAATQSLLTATTAASVLSGASLGDASALAALFMTACGGFLEWDAADSGVQQYVLSPFFTLGATASVVGNLGLIGGVFALHWSVVTLVRLRQSSRSHHVAVSAAELLRFPSASHRLAAFLLPGALFASCHAASSAAVSGVAAGAFGVAAGVFVVGAALRVSWWVRDSNMAHCSVVSNRRVADLWVPPMVRRRLVARALWVPAGVSQQYGSFYSSVSQRAYIPAQILLQYHGAVFSLVAAIPFHGSAQCAAQFALLAAWCLVPAALVCVSGFTLMRRPLSNPLAFVSQVLTAVLVVVTGVQTAGDSAVAAVVGEIVGVLLSVVGAVSAGYGVFCLVVERGAAVGASVKGGKSTSIGAPHVRRTHDDIEGILRHQHYLPLLSRSSSQFTPIEAPRSTMQRRQRLQLLVMTVCSSRNKATKE